jgi:MFS family permease
MGHATAAADVGFGAVVAVPGVLALLAVLFLVNFIGRSFTPILPLHLQDLGLAPTRLASATGILISAYSVAAAASAALVGRASRTRSPRTLLLLSLVGGALAVLPMALVPNYESFLALAVLLGLASGGSLTLGYTIGGLMVPEAVRATAFGFLSGAALLGGAVSPTVAGLVAHATLRGIYWVDAALYLGLAVALLWGGLLRQSPSPSTEGDSSPSPLAEADHSVSSRPKGITLTP